MLLIREQLANPETTESDRETHKAHVHLKVQAIKNDQYDLKDSEFEMSLNG